MIAQSNIIEIKEIDWKSLDTFSKKDMNIQNDALTLSDIKIFFITQKA